MSDEKLFAEAFEDILLGMVKRDINKKELKSWQKPNADPREVVGHTDVEHQTEVNKFQEKRKKIQNEFVGNGNEPTKEEVDTILANIKEYTGSSVSYYKIHVARPTTADKPYDAEANDIIESLGMTFAEGNAFKAIWRLCAARKGLSKQGYTDAVYDSEKVVFFGKRMVEAARADRDATKRELGVGGSFA